jgi:hypothetical protein
MEGSDKHSLRIWGKDFQEAQTLCVEGEYDK